MISASAVATNSSVVLSLPRIGMSYNSRMGPLVQPYEPTPAEIAAACQAIQATWSPREEYQRRTMLADVPRRARNGAPRRRWQPPMITLDPDVAQAVGA